MNSVGVVRYVCETSAEVANTVAALSSAISFATAWSYHFVCLRQALCSQRTETKVWNRGKRRDQEVVLELLLSLLHQPVLQGSNPVECEMLWFRLFSFSVLFCLIRPMHIFGIRLMTSTAQSPKNLPEAVLVDVYLSKRTSCVSLRK